MEEKIDEFEEFLTESARRIADYEQLEWQLIETENPEKRWVRLYGTHDHDGKYFLKCQAVMKNTDGRRILQLNIDNAYETRRQWETGELMGIEQLEQYGRQMKLIHYRIAVGVWGVSDRDFLGVQKWAHDGEKDLYTLVFKTCKDERWPPIDGCVAGTCESILQIRRYQNTNDHVVTIYATVEPNGWIPSWFLPLIRQWKEKMRDRMILYRDVAQNRFEEIYHTVFCPACGAEWPSTEDMCRRCRAAFK